MEKVMAFRQSESTHLEPKKKKISVLLIWFCWLGFDDNYLLWLWISGRNYPQLLHRLLTWFILRCTRVPDPSLGPPRAGGTRWRVWRCSCSSASSGTPPTRWGRGRRWRVLWLPRSPGGTTNCRTRWLPVPSQPGIDKLEGTRRSYRHRPGEAGTALCRVPWRSLALYLKINK